MAALLSLNPLETSQSFLIPQAFPILFQGYKDDMVNPEMQHLIPIQLYGKSDILFGNLEQIYLFHNDVFLRDLENCIETTELIGLCFVQRVRKYDFFN